MAIMLLKQWAFKRTALRHGHTCKIEFSGWKERRRSEADSRNVRVLDFQRALSQLDLAHQQILILTFRDVIRHAEGASMLGVSNRGWLKLLPVLQISPIGLCAPSS
jgi:hypothetical protein